MCLSIGGDAVPLLKTSVTVDIVDDDATVSLCQDFANPAFGKKGEKQEAVYDFPLQSNSAVYSFKSTFLSENGDVLKTLIGKAVEKQAAREKYEQAKANGQSAQLLEQDFDNSPDVFTLSVGNIPPEAKTVKVQIGYYVALTEEEKGAVKRFMLPATVSGRYGKTTDNGWSKKNVSAGGSLFEIDVNISLSDNVSLIDCPSHKVTSKLFVDGSPSKASVSFAGDSERLSSDFVLKIGGSETPKSSLLVQDPSTITNETFMKTFGDATIAKMTFQILDSSQDEEIDGTTTQNFVFVVDRSGSMSGSSMENCKKALLLCLSCLPENCVFNICSFGSNHSFLFNDSKEYSEATLNEARAHVQSMSADMGGTEILSPMKEIVESKKSKFPTIVFLLTDGEVYDTDKIITTIKKAHKNSGTRVFSCGIGSGVSTHLVEGLAKAGGGTATFIAYGEKMNAKLSAQMEQAMYPPYESLKVEMGDLKLCGATMAWDVNQVLPKFALSGQTLSFYVALETGSIIEVEKRIAAGEKVESVKLLGTQKTEEDQKSIVVAEVDLLKNFSKSNCNLIVPALREQVKKSEEIATAKKREKKRALELSLCANIVSKFTSLVAVEELADGKLVEESVLAAEIRKAPVKQASKSSMLKGAMFFGGPKAAPMKRRRQKKTSSAKQTSSSDVSSLLKMHIVLTPRDKQSAPEPMAVFQAPPSLRGQLDMSAMPPPVPGAFSRRSEKKARSLDEDEDSSSFGSPKNQLENLSTTNEGMKLLAKEMAEEEELTLPAPKLLMDDQFFPPPNIAPKAPAVSVKAPVSDDEKLNILIGLQKTDGSFEATAALANLMEKKDLGADAATLGFATAVAVVFMEVKLSGLKAEWKLLHKKAIKYLKKNAKEFDELMGLARTFV